MSDTHYEVNKKGAIGVLVMIIVSLLGFGAKSHLATNKEDKVELQLKDVRLGEAIEINQRAIQLSTIERMADRQLLAVQQEKMSGHENNSTAHTN